ncbi:hypothetical protein P154DRAFT_540975 [Amniculicola lignicola CBS 123094]|uniref:Uncharacterized protein n=1 Tax=Amniculicola lignicola CBS 123094 TaxID=1392246 RepID=A0A6A5VXY4_9PLEO|nr:hypothetical protein P154DRAFT_540975 [Amniculicola lignicola CBS 123094]
MRLPFGKFLLLLLLLLLMPTIQATVRTVSHIHFDYAQPPIHCETSTEASFIQQAQRSSLSNMSRESGIPKYFGQKIEYFTKAAEPTKGWNGGPPKQPPIGTPIGPEPPEPRRTCQFPNCKEMITISFENKCVYHCYSSAYPIRMDTTIRHIGVCIEDGCENRPLGMGDFPECCVVHNHDHLLNTYLGDVEHLPTASYKEESGEAQVESLSKERNKEGTIEGPTGGPDSSKR